jgi:predicted N-acetyltransferase YhbS
MDPHSRGSVTLRTATLADLSAIERLLTERGDASDAVDVELVMRSEGTGGIAVALDGERVVSTLTLLDEIVHIDGVAVPAGQVELVATDVEYEGRGLVRALMIWAHERSRQRGHLLQVMVGIPFFYRQFGYEYAIPMPQWRRLVATPPPPRDLGIRRATVADLPALQALQVHAQARVDVRMGHTPACWRWILDGTSSTLWIAERDGTACGMARQPATETPIVAELACSDDIAALGLVAHVATGSTTSPLIQHSAGVTASLEPYLGEPTDTPEWYYARVGRLAPLLARLEPALQARLRAAGLGGDDHEVLLSSWRSHVRFTIGPSGFVLLAEGAAEQAPVSKGGSGVPPDALASLVLGPYGALGLEQRLPDCHLGDQRELMAALFPPRTADLTTFYLAV